MSTAWLFPGHGSQYVGMGRALLRDTAQGRAWLHRAEALSGLPLGAYADRGPLARLRQPTVLEPLLAAVSCAYTDWLRAAGLEPVAVAGYSAGTVSALYAAGVLDPHTCLRIACLRGAALEAAAAARPGGLLSLSGAPAQELIGVVNELDRADVLGVAAYNAPRHVTVAGSSDMLMGVAARARALGAEVGAIDAAGPWHTSMMEPAQRKLLASLAELELAAPRITVWLGSSGAACGESTALRDALADSIVLPVRWQQLVEGLLRSGVDDFLEVGPGHTLYGLLGQLPLPPRVTRGCLERPGRRRLVAPPPRPHPLIADRRGIHESLPH